MSVRSTPPTGRPKALVFIDADQLIRHFVHAGAFDALAQHYDVTYVFLDEVGQDKRAIHSDIDSLKLDSVRKVAVSRKRMGQWYFLFATSVLRLQRGTENYAPRRQLFVDVVGEKRVRQLEFLSRWPVYPFFRFAYRTYMGRYAPIEEILEAEQPDVVIQPSILTGHFINELLVSCRHRKLPYIVLMNSWDNPSVKAMATGTPDKLVVWGPQSQQYAQTYMGMPQEKIESFGAAQFQVYRDIRPETEDELRVIFDVPAGKRILLYAGSGSGAYETAYLKSLEALVESGKLKNCHIIYRPHPWRGPLEDGEEDFTALAWKHVSMDPFMRDFYTSRISGDTASFYLLDYTTTAQLLELVTAVISPLSTILLEATIKGKPVLLFSPEEGMQLGSSLSQIHFKDFVGKAGVLVSNSLEDFPEKCAALLELAEEDETSEKLQEAATQFAIMDGPRYGDRLLSLANQYVDQPAAGNF